MSAAQFQGVGFRSTFRNSSAMALDSIRAHRLRSFLTLLGVIIGVASVVLVGSAIEGLGVYTERSVAQAFGTESFLVAQIASVGPLTRKQVAEKLRRNKPMQKDEVEFLRAATGDNVLYSPFRQTFQDVKAGDQIYELAVIIGAGATLPDIREVLVGDGRFFTEQEERARQAVAVIGLDIKERFFPNGSALGKTFKLNGIDFTVVGVQEKLGSAFGRSQDNSVYIPYSMYERLFGPGTGFPVFGRARPDSGLDMDGALDEARAALRSKFGARPGQEDPFDTLTPTAIRGFLDSILSLISAIVVPVTMISLVVGGIVIMNIMLVSVTERTREIGIRKSLGARHEDIMWQFLLEALYLAVVGGLIGLLLAVALTSFATRAFGATLAVTTPYVLLAVFVSTGVGLISGYYPARRAARLDPIAALRAE